MNLKQTWSLELFWRRIFSLSLSRRIPEPSFSSSSFSAAIFFDLPLSEAVERSSSSSPGQLRGGTVTGTRSTAEPGVPSVFFLAYQRVSEFDLNDAFEAICAQ